MRDIVLLAILPFLVYAMIQRPFIGLGMWIWTAMFFPNGWVYGLADNIRFNLLFTGLTIFAYLKSKQKLRLQLGMLGTLGAFFFFWTTITTLFGLAPAAISWEFWGRLAKIMALFLFILLIMENKLHIDFFLWCLILSIGFFAGLEGLKYIASGGGHRIEGMSGHVIGDRNDLALALAMLLPICFYLLREYGSKHSFLKLGLTGLICLIVISIVGTNSRGGLVAMLSVGTYIFLKSERKLLLALLILGFVVIMVGVIPEQWYARMNTIGAAGADSSFMGRVIAWKLSFILAMQHPFVGGGFKALEYFPVWTALSQDFFQYPFFYAGDEPPNANRSFAAHSIYFQVLGDHGFVGLAIFVSILIFAFKKAGHIASMVRQSGCAEWLEHLAIALRLSVFAYAIGGIALSFAYFDFIYAIIAVIQVLELRMLPDEIARVRKLPAQA